jgi:hypothetical protein
VLTFHQFPEVQNVGLHLLVMDLHKRLNAMQAASPPWLSEPERAPAAIASWSHSVDFADKPSEQPQVCNQMSKVEQILLV